MKAMQMWQEKAKMQEEKVSISSSKSTQYGKKNNPFPGLRPFKIEESHLFFGREGQSDEVLLKLSQHRFVGVIGPSGSGKSSFIYCGVLPILYGGFLTGRSTNWEVVVTRPGAAPIDNLAQSIYKADSKGKETSDEDAKIKQTIISSLLKSSSVGLVETIMQIKGDEEKNYLILVDQFEELFRFKDSSNMQSVNETLAFINLLMEAVNHADVPIYVAITMRSDFIGECSQFPELTRQINDSQYLIPQMTREQKRRAITGPVAVGNAEIAPRLTQQLLNDLGDNPDQLPILQHALMRTWDYWSHFRDYDHEPLDIKHYEAIGTMSEALSMHANEAYEELNEEQQRNCEFLFKAITEKRGGGSYGIRRPTQLHEIASIANTSEEKIIQVIEKFRDPSRSLLTPQFGVPLHSNSIIDISHESIMRIWSRLKNWVNDEADAVAMYKRLAQAADMFQQGKTSLWRPPDLQLALNWKEKHNPTLVWGQRYHPAYERTISFLEHSAEEYEIEQRAKELQQKRRLRTARLTALIMAGATVISVLFLIYAFYQQTVAERNERLAMEQKDIAEQQKELAEEQRLLAIQKEEEATEAKNDAEESADLAEQRRIQATQSAALAEERRIAAVKAEGEASEAAIAAREAEKQANQEKERAEQEKSRADQLRYLAIANAIAVKAPQLNDPQLKGLLAQQAYSFNKRYSNYNYDPEIYDGLYYALKDFGHALTNKIKGHNKSAKVVIGGITDDEFYSAGAQGSILKWTKNSSQWVADTVAPIRNRRVVKSMIFDEENNIMFAAGQFITESGESIIESYDLTQNRPDPKIIKGVSGAFVKMYLADDHIWVLDEGGTSIKKLVNGKSQKIYQSDIKINDFTVEENKDNIWLATENGDLVKINKAGEDAMIMFTNSAELSTITSKFNFIVIGDINGTVNLFTDYNFSAPNALTGHMGGIDELKVSDNGSALLSAAKDKTVRVWNLSEITQPPIVLSDHDDWVWSTDFSANNKWIFSASEDGLIKVWPYSTEIMGDKLCNELNRNMSQTEWATYIGSDLDYEKTCENLEKLTDASQ
ncbi:High-affnity carbon uptake protein Hat/HatR [Marivirga arenosa]|uniref:High-affnity carbon uptake protein Hat/HatR n=1 Tax=Marivirga arenosa TaxID=3059076 RepID=A0AA51N814_9BACT|nr:High-affnity carbon uptake protein Hat/HatR [Marivirga sp. ABR2-2]WMN07708.1 High-affnity carbon uptake protein Hat/HatR [Marivirga sp. ABR2-2]